MNNNFRNYRIHNKKAQHIAEYMVVFEVFAVATVILVTSLGYLPEMGSSSMFRRSDQLLSIGPLGLLEHDFDECGGYRLRFRNNKDFPITLKYVKIGNEVIFNSSLTFLPGSVHYIEGLMGQRNKNGKFYELPISVSYINEETGGIVTEKYDDPLYGTYLKSMQIGRKTYLNQKLLTDFCFVNGLKNHIYGKAGLLTNNIKFNDIGNGYREIKFNGLNSYANAGVITNKPLSNFIIEAVLKANYTEDEKGIFYKPNAFYLTVNKNMLNFGVFSNGNSKAVSSSFPEDKFVVVHLEYSNNKIRFFMNGALKQELPINKYDGSDYDVYIGTFTPESKRNSYMSLLSFSFFANSFNDDIIMNRAKDLLRIVSTKK